MASPCVSYRCVQCCLATEMPLSIRDVENIRRLGFKVDDFVIRTDGWLQLRNYDRRCIFNNGERCLIYENRPEGCRLYPVIYDDDAKCAVLDEGCPHRNDFTISKINEATLFSLVKKIDEEKKKGRSKPK